MEILGWLLLSANFLVLPCFLFLLLIALAAMLPRRVRFLPQEIRTRFMIVIPAHNEESGIARSVASCRSSVYPESLFQVVVIADNCTDRTAAAAVDAGARVVERFDSVKKSKGYALEYLIQRLVESGEFDSLDALVVVDADTTIDPELLVEFDGDLQAGRDWIQCYYTVSNPDQSWRTRLMTYAFSLMNGVLLLGQGALGASAGLRGNGMCFSTRGLRRVPFTSYGLVEDMEYSWTLRVAGETITFRPEARVYGEMVGSAGLAAANQRRRWEFGRGEIRKKYFGPLLRSKRISGWEKLISFLDLVTPSMGTLLPISACLLLLNVTAFVMSSWLHSPTRAWVFVFFSLLMTIALGIYAISPFFAMRLPWRYASIVMHVPVFIIWKLVVSLRGRPKEWVRTSRESRRSVEVATQSLDI